MSENKVESYSGGYYRNIISHVIQAVICSNMTSKSLPIDLAKTVVTVVGVPVVIDMGYIAVDPYAPTTPKIPAPHRFHIPLISTSVYLVHAFARPPTGLLPNMVRVNKYYTAVGIAYEASFKLFPRTDTYSV